MYLKSIELYGFKSFANKMIFKFDKGITGIVGPNGSGKSNVADAVRWVLGEQSAKQLRGSKMEDVIFAGTEMRRALGYCQVDLTINNQDKKMPIDYSEVTVSRRVYRSGESEYYINGTTCRLRDVQELFMDTGVGREGYSIIGQGQVDKILSSKPDDRRALFDEAAGIVKYKTRKNAAIRKLDNGEQDLERITDIIMELEGQKESLEGQAEIAREFLDKREELKKYEVNSFIRLIDEFDSKLSVLKETESVATAELQAKAELYKEIAAQHHQYENEFEKIEQELEINREKITETTLEIEKSQSSINLSEEKVKNNNNQAEKLKAEIERLQDTEIERTRELNNMKNEREKVAKKLIEKEIEIDERQLVLNSMQEEIENYEKQIEEIQTNMIERLNAQSNIKGQVNRQEMQIENFSTRKEHLIGRKHILDKTMTELEKELDQNKETIDAYEEQQKQLLDEKLTLRKNISDMEVKHSKQQEDVNRQRHELNKNASRYEAIKDLEDQYDGYYLSVKKVMTLNDPGALGVIAELIRVEKRFEQAIEIALGSALQNIVTTNGDKAKEFIDYLKKNRFGRATFLPMTTVKGDVLSGFKEGSGFIGIASELIDCDEQYRPIIRQLLGRILIVDNLDSGQQIARANNQRVRIITLEGDVISAGGAMSGGAFKREKGQLLSRKNELEALIATITNQRRDVKEADKKNQALEIDLNILKENIEQIRVKENDLNIEMHTVSTRINANQSELQKYAVELHDIGGELEDLEDQIHKTTDEKESLASQLDHSVTDHSDAEEKVRELNEYIQTLKEDREITFDEITDDKMSLSSMKQQETHLAESVERLGLNLENKTESIKMVRREINSLELLNLKEMQVMKESQDSQLMAKDLLATLNEKLGDLRYNRQQIQISKGQLDSKKEIAHDEANQLEKEMIRITSNIEKLDLQKETQINYMWDEYELTYSTALALRLEEDVSDSAMKARILKLKGEIKALGDVNVHAIEEYRTVKERYTFLSTQRDDLTEAKEKLLKIISDLDEQMTVQFREKFDEINLTFNVVFKELFGGGKGFLELTDNEDILGAGITIVAQPPGKKLQNMMLLSGGERAFTAIALLFSIQSLRPSPFCVLDEIEAALDDANVDRFAAYLQRLTDQTQFIVITHRKGTMEAADALYGITMQEKGISTQVSVKLIQDQLSDMK